MHAYKENQSHINSIIEESSDDGHDNVNQIDKLLCSSPNDSSKSEDLDGWCDEVLRTSDISKANTASAAAQENIKYIIERNDATVD